MTVRGVRGGVHKNADQQRMRAIWRTKAWKERVKALLLENQRCAWCNGKSSVVNHKRQGYYQGYQLCRRDEVDIICQPCHQYWTKTGIQRPQLYDDCFSCESLVYVGRKVCWQCGGAVIAKKLKQSREATERLMRIYSRCPEVRVEDVWIDVWVWGKDPVTVTGFQSQDNLPWPMVKTDRGETGLPAFGFGELKSRGAGQSWEELFGISRQIENE